MIPFQFHTHRITFLGVNHGFVTVCEASLCVDHDFFCTLLSYVIHFLSPVMNPLKNGLISFRFNNDSQIEIRSIKFFTVQIMWRLNIEIFLSSLLEMI